MRDDVFEFELATIPSEGAPNRLVFVLRKTGRANSYILKRESFSENIGWFVQSEIEMSRDEANAMRAVLGATVKSAPAGGRTSRDGAECHSSNFCDILPFPVPSAAAS